jgi:hypothetical protein
MTAAERIRAPARGVLTLLLVLAAAGDPVDSRQPAAEPDPYARALALYRHQRYAEAEALLERALSEGGPRRGYRSLLGWCYVQQGRHAEGADAFRAALAEEPSSREARTGLASALAGAGRAAEALDLALPLLVEDPNDADLLAAAGRALAQTGKVADRRLRPAAASREVLVVARAGRDHLEARWNGRFVPLFVKGVNLSVALPGRFPAEFPEEAAVYRGWLDQIAGMGANAVRLYTLLPPAFYRALHDHNFGALARAGAGAAAPPRGFLWLIQGVWTELPESDLYDDPAFERGFVEETERVVDAVHGGIAVARRPGHAFGVYLHDVSSMTLALILGREWEPYSVAAYDAARPEGGSFEGRHFTVDGGTAMEAWLASVMDRAAAYEARVHASARPLAFTNWPTLDPLRHPTEATKDEERELARRLLLPFELRAVREYDNDGVGVDVNRIRPTAAAPAGLFASYHAYPYYPDFMNLDPGYLRARDRRGPNNYAGYLRELRAHHAGMPVLIAEVGVPTSRGVAHVQPQGFHHGGHDEKGQGEVDARLMETIHETGCAGGILFAWLDEWFKRNWLVIDFELPAERNPKWLNALDPEQNYGLLAARPGSGGPPVILDSRVEDWSGRKPLMTGTFPRALFAAHDEAYLYLRLDAGPFEWDRRRFLIGIDTYGAEEGDRRFPGPCEASAPTGMEFAVELAGPGSSRILVDPPYDLHTHRYDRPYRSAPNADGVFIEILAETNRRRIGRDGTSYPEIVHNRSPLRHGTTDPEAAGYDDLADWFSDPLGGVVEIRLPWGLLNVTDPSSRRVVEDPPDFGDEVGTRVTEGLRLYVAACDPAAGALLGTLPVLAGEGRIAADPSALYAWPGWEEPAYHTRLKRSYFVLKDRLAAIPDVAAP